jgi:hypothetical protein
VIWTELFFSVQMLHLMTDGDSRAYCSANEGLSDPAHGTCCLQPERDAAVRRSDVRLTQSDMDNQSVPSEQRLPALGWHKWKNGYSQQARRRKEV